MKDGSQVEYIGGLFKGTMSIIDVPSQATLDQYTRRVYENAPYSPQKTANAGIADEGNPIPMKLGEKSPIKYVFM